MKSVFEINNTTVNVRGTLDRDTLKNNWWPSLDARQQNHLQEQADCHFDLSQVERVDSAGLAWLVNAIRDCNEQGVSVHLRQVPEKLLKLAKISDVDSLLPLE